MTARQVELKRLASEAKETASRWMGMAGALQTLEGYSRRRETRDTASFRVLQSNVVTAASARLQDSVDFLVRIKLLAAKERR